ncbi:MAG: hypothetical protein R3C55_02555 [Parvularculaceae bacterium]
MEVAPTRSEVDFFLLASRQSPRLYHAGFLEVFGASSSAAKSPEPACAKADIDLDLAAALRKPRRFHAVERRNTVFKESFRNALQLCVSLA